MSVQDVILRAGRGDHFILDGSPIVFTLDAKGDAPAADIQQNRLWESLDLLGLRPPQVAIDLYRVCAAAYCADLRLPRSAGYDGWTRRIVLHTPVADPELWAANVEPLTELLCFLSGDVWSIQLRKRAVPAPEVKSRAGTTGGLEAPENEDRPSFAAACLFSGGLDSFIGAADRVAAGESLLLVSHVPEGVSRFVSPAQDALYRGLTRSHTDQRLEHVKVTLNPPPVTEKTAKESTQRARSILFFGLGTLVAAAIGEGTPLVVPENGFISLNLPLTPGRIGSLSTRTTHPYAIDLYRKLVEGLLLDVPIDVPYMFKTKGEMVAHSRAPEVVHRLAEKSISCASPNPYGPAQESHCGHCVPCIIRRAAMHTAGLDDPKDYRLDIRNPGRELTDSEAAHLTAFRMAIRRRADGVSTADLLAAGPIPGHIGSLANFKDVHDRGLAEVGVFLDEAK